MYQLQQLKDQLKHFVEQVQLSDISRAQKAQIIKHFVVIADLLNDEMKPTEFERPHQRDN